jgi:hypothetical protein
MMAQGKTWKLRYLRGPVAVALIMTIAVGTAGASPYNFFDPPAKPADIQPKPPTHTKGRLAPHKSGGEDKKQVATQPRPRNAGPRRLEFGDPSLGLETDAAVKRRSLSGDIADPERDLNIGPPRQNRLPPFLGLSLKTPFSW